MTSSLLSKVEAKSSVYGELLGSGIGLSLNYEYFIRDDLPLRVGFGYLLYVYSIPITLSKLIGESRHKLELGGGIVPTFAFIGFSGVFSGVIGYRYQPEVRSSTFRLSFTPMFFPDDPYVLPWFGVSYGYTF